ncbi:MULTISPECIES: DUF3634 family protein [unclassified Agarivorans]|uniref:DUF3634 family protein n=1 Tax=unclassified Agarivorans TaxID=2636026 RepID=UPI003D7C8B89
MLKAISAAFVIKIDGIRVEVTKGRVPEYFIREIKLLQGNSGAINGKLYGMRRGRQINLECSSSIPDNILQRLRNVWRPNPDPGNNNQGRLRH